MDNEEKMKAISYFQNACIVHPLTCGNSSLHASLVPSLKNDEVVLTCLNCSYEQEWVPDYVYEFYRFSALPEKEGEDG